MNFQRKRYLFVLVTRFSSKKEVIDAKYWKKLVQATKSVDFTDTFTNWNSNVIEEKLPHQSIQDFEKTSDKIHLTLDNIQDEDYLLDILWICDSVPTLKKFPPCLLGALKRSVDWHRARINLVCEKAEKHPFIQELRVKHYPKADQLSFDANLVWRGTLAFFDEEVSNYQHMGAFDLSWKTGDLDIPDNAHFSQRLKVLSKCTMTTVPPYFLTESKLKLKTSILSSEDDITEDFMKDSDMFGPHNCVIAKLERFEPPAISNGLKMKKTNVLDTESWKKAVLEGQIVLEVDQDLQGKSLKSLYMLIYDNETESDNHLEKTCIVLDPNASANGYAKSYDVISNLTIAKDDSQNTFKEALVYDNIDLGLLKNFVDKILPMVMEEMKRRFPEAEHDEENLKQNAIKVIHKYVQDKLEMKQVQVPEDCQDCQNLSYDGYEAFPKLDTNERRFLAFIEQTKKKSEEKRKASLAVMAPSGDFVVLEAKELIKHFTKDGLPKNLDQCQVLKPINSRTVSKLTQEQLKSQKWPEQFLTEFHDVYYNRSESSEKADQVNAKVQQMYVGSRETASTCHGLNSEQTVVQTSSLSNSNNPAASSNSLVKSESIVKNEKSNLRRTPRKIRPVPADSKTANRQPAASKDPQSVFK